MLSIPKNHSRKSTTVSTSPQLKNRGGKSTAVHPYTQSTNNKVLKESNTLAETDITLQQIKNLILQHYLKSRKWKSKSGKMITSASISDYLQEWASQNEDFGYVGKKLKVNEKLSNGLQRL